MARKRRKKKNSGQILAGLLFLFIMAAILFGVFCLRDYGARNRALVAAPTPAPPVEVTAVPVTPAPAATPVPTPEPTPEPQPEYFTLSFIGDNTLWANSQFVNNPVGLPLTVGDDTSYPYKNTVSYFNSDEFTLANLECSFSDQKMYSGEQFSFLAPTKYAQILVDGCVDFVTMANNHTMDFYEAGRDDTIAALDAVGIPHGIENQHQIVTTPSGLKLGIYTGYNTYHPEDNWNSLEEAIQEMRSSGADLIIVMFHWGQELYYTPNANQTDLAHKCIDAGADIVYGSHPHCLQPVEVYNDKLILYSAGNWVFGGNTQPSDPDTAIFQAIIKRDLDGAVSYDSFKVIPCCISTNIDGGNAKANNTSYDAYANYNDYCPTPYEEGSEGYSRTMSKLNGTFEAKSQGADYTDYYASWG